MFAAVPEALAMTAAEAAARGESLVFVARDGVVEGLIAIADPVKQGAAQAMADLRALGWRRR